jgi:hypothetical protein
MIIVRYVSCLVFCALLSGPAVAGIWQLEMTTLPPKEEYPKGVVTEDFEQILGTYNTYMHAFTESDFHTMADQMDFKSKSLAWSNRLDAIDNFSFIKDHILPDYSHSDAFDISFISTKVGGYVLSVKRIYKNESGKRISSAWGFYEFKEVDNNWKISNIMTIPSLRSPF